MFIKDFIIRAEGKREKERERVPIKKNTKYRII